MSVFPQTPPPPINTLSPCTCPPMSKKKSSENPEYKYCTNRIVPRWRLLFHKTISFLPWMFSPSYVPVQVMYRARVSKAISAGCFYEKLVVLVCEIPRIFERARPSNFRTQGSFIYTKQQKNFECDLLSSDNVAKSTTWKPWVFWDWSASK